MHLEISSATWRRPVSAWMCKTWDRDRMSVILQTIWISFSCVKIIVIDSNVTEIFHKGPINNKPTLVQMMACRLTGDKPLSEYMVV